MNLLFNIAVIITFIIPVKLMAENYCGDINSSSKPQYVQGRTYGPYDYTNSVHRKNNLPVVEGAHFTKETEGLNTRSAGADIDYTLRAFPNHHRALAAMSKLGLRDKTYNPAGFSYTILCFFDRATRYRPNDALVRAIFSGHLLKIGQLDMALEQLMIATELEANNPIFNYNLGLLYFDKKDYAQAKKYADKAYSQDFPLPGLRNKLINKGKWGN